MRQYIKSIKSKIDDRINDYEKEAKTGHRFFLAIFVTIGKCVCTENAKR